MHQRIIAMSLFINCLLTSACVVGGYSSRGGWFVWPGGFGLVVIGILILLWWWRRG